MPAHRAQQKRRAAAADVTHIKDLVPDPKNRRKHTPRNIGMIVDALQKVGAGRSIVIDETNEVLAGNGVLEAAAEAGLTKVQVVDTDGSTIIAVRRTGLTADQKRDLAIYDNRAAELAEWDTTQLRSDHEAGVDLSAFFGEKELVQFWAKVDPTAGATDPDAVPASRATSIRRGYVFALGEHRLLCGDSTAPESVRRVMGEARARLMNTDPPYGIAYTDETRVAAERAHGRPQRQAKWTGGLENDGALDGPKLQAFLETAIRAAVPCLADNAAFYLWHPMLTQGTFFAAAAADVLIHRQIIWVKPSLLFGFGDYHWRHELCFYGWRRGHRPEFYGERNQTTVWEITHETSNGHRDHPTQKPVELFIRPIRNHCTDGDVIYEPFAGSGSQVIAAEQTSVSCRAIEIDPVYCQVVIDRWEAFTGKKAKKVGEVSSAA